jgi:hypothetical protein
MLLLTQQLLWLHCNAAVTLLKEILSMQLIVFVAEVL